MANNTKLLLTMFLRGSVIVLANAAPTVGLDSVKAGRPDGWWAAADRLGALAAVR